MQNVTAILSMIHEPASPSSASRYFRQQPVLAWTLQRLAMSSELTSIAILCWEDQLNDVAPLASAYDTHVLTKGPRVTIPSIESVAAARRWADGWRGGLLSTCDSDLGFHGPWIREIVQNINADAAILIDPSAGLVDAKIIDGIIAHARKHENVEFVFTQAPPGLGGVLLRPALIGRLAEAKMHPGRILHYLPDQPMRDPISGDGCFPIATPVARSTRNFRLDSDRQVTLLTEAAVDLNGQLATSDAENLLNRLDWTPEVAPAPRELTIELNTTRATKPIYSPASSLQFTRGEISERMITDVLESIARIGADDLRVTLGGVGDPLLHPQFAAIVRALKSAGVQAIHVETDLLPPSGDVIDQLADEQVDVVSIHLPAMSPQTYAAVMGVDRFGEVVENMRRLLVRRATLGAGRPIVVPTFTKCTANLAEMEAWYDQWLKALGSAVIVGASDYAGTIANVGVADMSPPKRTPCRRLWSRMTIHSDGKVASCEQDVLGRQIAGDVATSSLTDIWQQGIGALRDSHRKSCYAANSPACAACREWHRP